MLTTKNAYYAILRLDNILGNEATQNILMGNIGFVDNDDIVNVWIFPKTNSHVTINNETKLKIINTCKLNINTKMKKYINYSLNDLKHANYDFTENILINGEQKREYEPKLLLDFVKGNINKLVKQNNELLELNQKLQKENLELKIQINSNDKNL